MFDKVKAALRVTSNVFDGEISGLIDACLSDLRLVGVHKATHSKAVGPLIERAIILYAKANFGYLPDSEKYQKAYDYLKCRLSLAGD